MKTFEHEWIFTPFAEHRSFFTKRMFGGLAAYLIFNGISASTLGGCIAGLGCRWARMPTPWRHTRRRCHQERWWRAQR